MSISGSTSQRRRAQGHLEPVQEALDQLIDEELATITKVIDALVTKAKLLVTGGAG